MNSADSREPASPLSEYLDTIGLEFNPFEGSEASADRKLLTYAINHPVMEKAWEERDFLITGPRGSGRTAVGERLAYACRVGDDSRSVFPIILRQEGVNPGKVNEALAKAAAAELVLEIAYNPRIFDRMTDGDRRRAVAAMESASPGLLDQLLPQVELERSYLPVAQFFDPAGVTLPNPPDPDKVKQVATEIRRINDGLTGFEIGSASPLEAVIAASGAKEVMFIADIEPGQCAQVMKTINRARQTALNATVKLLVPAQTENEKPLIPKETGEFHQATMEWWEEQLIEVLQKRLKTASGGQFDSFDAISGPGLKDVEEIIVYTLKEKLPAVTPRDVIAFANRLLQAGATSGDNSLTDEVFTKTKKEFLRK